MLKYVSNPTADGCASWKRLNTGPFLAHPVCMLLICVSHPTFLPSAATSLQIQSGIPHPFRKSGAARLIRLSCRRASTFPNSRCSIQHSQCTVCPSVAFHWPYAAIRHLKKMLLRGLKHRGGFFIHCSPAHQDRRRMLSLFSGGAERSLLSQPAIRSLHLAVLVDVAGVMLRTLLPCRRDF